jgi:hypothetical protein
MISALRRKGNLPPGIHRASWFELEARLGGSQRRETLLVGLREALEALRRAGCRTAYLDGSFVTTKDEPNDFDACWETVGVDFNALDPVLLDFSEARYGQKMRYGGEFFPTGMVADPEGTPFLDFFQHDRVGDQPKGILEIKLENGL